MDVLLRNQYFRRDCIRYTWNTPIKAYHQNKKWYFNDITCINNTDLLLEAVHKGDRYIIEKTNKELYYWNYEVVLRDSVEHGHLHLVQYFLDYYDSQNYLLQCIESIGYMVRHCLKTGHIDIIECFSKYFQKYSVINIDEIIQTLLIDDDIVLNNKTKVYKYMVEKGCIVDKESVISVVSSPNIYWHDSQYIIDFLREYGTDYIGDIDVLDDIIGNECSKEGTFEWANLVAVYDKYKHTNNEYNGNTCMDIIKYLIDSNVRHKKYIDTVVRYSIQYGTINIFQYLIEKKYWNVHAYNEKALRLSARYNRLNFIQYIVENFEDVNVHAKNEQALRLSFHMGYYEISEYLISKGANASVLPQEQIEKLNSLN